MKKILFFAFTMAAISFASCGNKVQSSEVSDSTAVDSAVVDSLDSVDTIAVDSTIVE